MTTTSLSKSPPAVAAGLDFIGFDEVARLAGLAASYWSSIALAAERGEALTVTVHCRQVAGVTKEAFAIVKTLGGGRDVGGAA